MRFLKSHFYTIFLQTLSFVISCLINLNKKFDPRKVESILVVRVDRLGDFLMSMPVFHAVRKHFPDKKITLLVGPNNQALIEGNPLFDEVLFYDSFEHRKKKLGHKNVLMNLRFLFGLRRHDLIIDLRSDLLVVIFALLKCRYYRVDWGTARTSERLNRILVGDQLPTRAVAANRIKDDGFLSKFFKLYPIEHWNKHFVETSVNSLRYLNIWDTDRNLSIHMEHDKEKLASDFLSSLHIQRKVIVGIHPGAGNREKIWGVENFAFVISELQKRGDVEIVLLYGEKEDDLVKEISKCLPRECKTFYHPDLQVVGAFLKQVDLLICNDSGIMHLAEAVGTRTVAIFNRTKPQSSGGITDRIRNYYVVCDAETARKEIIGTVGELLAVQ